MRGAALLLALHFTLVALSTLSQRGELYNRKMNRYESHFGKHQAREPLVPELFFEDWK